MRQVRVAAQCSNEIKKDMVQIFTGEQLLRDGIYRRAAGERVSMRLLTMSSLISVAFVLAVIKQTMQTPPNTWSSV